MEDKQTAVDYLFEMWVQDKTITQAVYEQAKKIEAEQFNEISDRTIAFVSSFLPPEVK